MNQEKIYRTAQLLNWYMIQKQDEINPKVSPQTCWDALRPSTQEHLLEKAHRFLSHLDYETPH